jgi:hypothetical protein
MISFSKQLTSIHGKETVEYLFMIWGACSVPSICGKQNREKLVFEADVKKCILPAEKRESGTKIASHG